ncbi:MAG: 16S rRNA (cytidine(1402)-2'-O)-methyltransferase [bacterium]|nr:16S rRNA (cytidine(1402)-2'-O)-methyltransferase [bacterium]
MGTLYVVATPIGNLADITQRAVATLRTVDLIACEDTRHTSILLRHLGITAPLTSYHQHSGAVKTDQVVRALGEGKNVAIVTDAGTPGVNDPGGKLVAAAAAAGHRVVPIPGPSALVAALSVSGLPVDDFRFMGFLPHKKGRQTAIAEIAAADTAVVFYESTHRILKALQQLALALAPDRPVVVCRELTKQFETVYRGNCSEVLQQLQAGVTKGEFVVIVGPVMKHLTADN